MQMIMLRTKGEDSSQDDHGPVPQLRRRSVPNRLARRSLTTMAHTSGPLANMNAVSKR